MASGVFLPLPRSCDPDETGSSGAGGRIALENDVSMQTNHPI